MDAAAEPAVVSSLRAQGYIPISIAPVGAARAGRGGGFSFKLPSLAAWRSRIRGRDLMLFTRELATLLEAGLPLDRSLQSLAGLSEKPAMRDVVTNVLTTVQGGKSLSEALADHDEVFPPLYVNMIRAAEAGGVVEAVLERLAEYLENTEELRSSVRSALAYPVFLALVAGAAIIIMLVYVLPNFTSLFDNMGVALPASTQMIITASDFIRDYWWAMAALVGVGIYGFRRWTSTPEGLLRWHRFLLDAPQVGDLVQKLQIARFGRTLGTMLKSGVPLLQSLEIVRAIVQNDVISRALVVVQKEVSEGKGLSGPLERTGVFPSMALQMVAVGEETGRLDDMLLVVGDHYDAEVTNAVQRLTSLLGPVILVVMGGVAGFIVISMMMAVFSMNSIDF